MALGCIVRQLWVKGSLFIIMTFLPASRWLFSSRFVCWLPSSIHSPIQAFIHPFNGFYFCVALSLQMKEQRRWQLHRKQMLKMSRVDMFQSCWDIEMTSRRWKSVNILCLLLNEIYKKEGRRERRYDSRYFWHSFYFWIHVLRKSFNLLHKNLPVYKSP